MTKPLLFMSQSRPGKTNQNSETQTEHSDLYGNLMARISAWHQGQPTQSGHETDINLNRPQTELLPRNSNSS